MPSVFAKYEKKNWPYRYSGQLHIFSIAGGVPVDPNVLGGHLKRKIDAPDNLIRAEIAEAMLEKGMTVDEAVDKLASEKGHVGFRQDKDGLYVAGSNLKAAIKEAASIAAAAGLIQAKGWGQTSHNKGILSWLAEHVFVVEDRLHLGTDTPTGTAQSFIAKITPKGPVSAIQYTDYVEDAVVDFTVETDHLFSEEDWAAIWLKGERNGLGAARKMGYGRYEVTRWELDDAPPRRRGVAR